jgi:hypothetical protein
MPGTQVEPRPENLPVHVPGMPQRKRESEALPAKLLRAARRNSAVSVPASLLPGAWTAAEILHFGGLVPEVAVTGGAVAGTVAVWLFAPHKWTGKDGEPRWPEVWYARSTAACFSGWLTAAAFLGPVSAAGPELAGSLAVLCAAWGVPWYRHKRVRGRKEREKLQGEWERWWAYWGPQLGYPSSRVIGVSDDGITVRLRLQLWAGHQTVAGLRSAVPGIESALQDFAAHGGVGIREVKGNKSQADLSFKRTNPLAELVAWDEPSAPKSVLDPWYPGLTETGRRRAMTQLGSLFTLGMKGTGKSTLLLLRILSLCGCLDAAPVLIDLKGGRSARPVLETGAADYVITELAEAEMALMMGEAELLARMEGAYDGHEQLAPDESTPALFFHADEVHRLSSVTRGSARAAASLAAIATTGRSANVLEDILTQYGSLESSVRTEETRMNLDLRFVFRMPRADMASFAIKEYAQLDVSRLEGAGECYAGDSPETDPEVLRVVNITHDAFRELAPARIARRGPKKDLKLWCGGQPCPAGGTWQEWWDSRWSRLPEAFREISVQYREWAEENGLDGETEGAEVTQPPAPATAAPELVRRHLAPLPPLEPGDEDEDGATAAARIAAETAGDDIAPVPAAAARVGEIRAANQARFWDLIAGAGPGGIRTADAIEQSGVSSTWAYDALGRVADRGAVTRVRQGSYAPVSGRHPGAEWAAVRAGDEALGGDARRYLQSVG